MGKTAKGAVWLDPEKTTPYEFYQYWRNVDDADVMKCMRMLTFKSLDEIREMDSWDDSRINEKKEILAYALTELVHGKEEADKAQNTARAIFSGNMAAEDMPATILRADLFTGGTIRLIDVLVACKLAPTNSEARRLITGNGISVDDIRITDPNAVLTQAQLKDSVVIRKGKKVFHRVSL